MELDQNRALLANFLRRCRERISPSVYNIKDIGRRRTKGLRREDVAWLGGISLSWYTWLEQGRDVRPSTEVLERVSKVLQLSPEERDYLFSLVHQRPPPLSLDDQKLVVSPRVRRMIDALPIPAVIHTSRWEIVAWNKPAIGIFRDYKALPLEERNVLWLVLNNSEVDEYADQYRALVHNMVSKLRVDYSHAPGDPSFDRLIERLSASSPQFVELWGDYDVSGEMEGVSVVHHPELGRIIFEHTCYQIEGTFLRMFVFSPIDEDSTHKLQLSNQQLADDFLAEEMVS